MESVNLDQRARGFLDFDSYFITECRDCKCDVIGSIDASCDAKQGLGPNYQVIKNLA